MSTFKCIAYGERTVEKKMKAAEATNNCRWR